ncbi:hypothetical protein, partial [Escherichia coli]|uniref:hypothetical protein n=1 Tax=Escherichia coli TaxID=562 RepID=UPI0039E18715
MRKAGFATDFLRANPELCLNIRNNRWCPDHGTFTFTAPAFLSPHAPCAIVPVFLADAVVHLLWT